MVEAGSNPSSPIAQSPRITNIPVADVYDELDKGLELVQGMCETAAHQFLRDGDCSEEVAGIQKRFTETKALAHREIERSKDVAPDSPTLDDDFILKARSFRRQTMRRGHAAVSVGPKELAAIAASASPSAEFGELEVDNGADNAAEEDMELPKMIYKRTRIMQ
jgi:hypothetical protein